MAGRFAGRTAVITGGVSGIGAGIAARLAAEGARLSLWDMDEAGLAKSSAAHTVTLDVTDADAVHRAAASTPPPHWEQSTYWLPPPGSPVRTCRRGIIRSRPGTR